MAINTSDIRSILNGLIETCKDSEEGFRYAADKIIDPEARRLFQGYASRRARFASELQNEVARIGGVAETSGSVLGTMHRGWINLKAAIADNNDHAILEEGERGEDIAMKIYREALDQDLPSEYYRIIERQFREVQQTHYKVRALRDHGMARTAGSTTNW